MQYIHDRETNIQSDKVGKRQRPHGMVHSQLHDPVDTLPGSDAFVERKDCLINHRHQNTIGNEAGRILTIKRRLSQSLSQAANLLVRIDPKWPFHESLRPVS